MATAHVQGSAANITSSTAGAPTFATAPTPGNLVCLALAFTAAITNLKVVDQNGNAYTVTPGSPSSFQSGAGQVWLAYWNAVGNPNRVLNISWTNTAAATIWLDEFSHAGNAKFDTDAGATNSTGATINTPTITPTFAGSLCYSGAAAASGAIFFPGAGNVQGGWTGAAGGIDGGQMAEYILSQAASNVAVSYLQGSGPWSAMAMSIMIDQPGHIQREGGTGNVALEDGTGDIALEA